MKQIGVMGASGRMGQEVIKQLELAEAFQFSQGVAQVDPYLSNVSDLDKEQVDAIIDFSLPGGFEKILDWCVGNKKPLVSGTTGLKAGQLAAFKEAGREIPVLWSPNMSVGVAVLRRALAVFKDAKWFDFAIEELHHSKKVDRPSGTALALKTTLEEQIEREVGEVSAIRGGGIYGIHSVFAMSEDEVIEFKHTSLNRSVWAAGAVKAMAWLLTQDKGSYSLEDMLR